MEYNDECISRDLRAHFQEQKVKDCVPYYPMLRNMATNRGMTVQDYLGALLEGKTRPVIYTSLIHWVVMQEVTADVAKGIPAPNLWSSKYEALVEAYVNVLFKKYALSDVAPGKSAKVFGITTFAVKAEEKAVELHFDGRCVVFERYEDAAMPDVLDHFLYRIDRLNQNFFAMESNVQYNTWSSRFFDKLTTNRNFHVRTHHRLEVFKVPYDSRQPFSRVHLCAISVCFTDKFYFVALGTDTENYLAAEAKAMRGAVEVVEGGRAPDVSRAQSACLKPLSTADIDAKYGIVYHFAKLHATETKFFTAATAVLTFNRSRYVVSAVSSSGKENAHAAIAAAAVKKIADLGAEWNQ